MKPTPSVRGIASTRTGPPGAGPPVRCATSARTAAATSDAVAVQVAAAHADQAGVAADEAPAEQPRQLVQVEVGERDRVGEAPRLGGVPPVADLARVDRGDGHAASASCGGLVAVRSRIAAAASRPLAIASSWKPQRQ